MDIARRRIEERRRALGLSYSRLSIDAGLSRSLVGKFVRGEVSTLRDENLAAIARVLGCTLGYLKGEPPLGEPLGADSAPRRPFTKQSEHSQQAQLSLIDIAPSAPGPTTVDPIPDHEPSEPPKADPSPTRHEAAPVGAARVEETPDDMPRTERMLEEASDSLDVGSDTPSQAQPLGMAQARQPAAEGLWAEEAQEGNVGTPSRRASEMSARKTADHGVVMRLVGIDRNQAHIHLEGTISFETAITLMDLFRKGLPER